jgi:uncharacterized protein (TIGR00255 family)
MIASMTGYGKAETEFQQKQITVEIKALNSKQLDINFKIPTIYKEKELDIRNEISKELERGKIDVFISVDSNGEETVTSVNSGIIKGYYSKIVDLANELNLQVPDDIMNTLLRLPDALKSEKQELSDEEWSTIFDALKKAMGTLKEFRKQEGEALSKDIMDRINLISDLSQNLEIFEEQRFEKIKQRIRQNLSEVVGKENIDENRFEQELIYYIEKLDITEEKVRLANHCKYFIETMREPESTGKKLGFITQELGREINTIGSKANDADMQKIVVKMKDELEKIKEQINNVL